MPGDRKFFLGRGERLTARVPPPGGGGGADPPYTFAEAVGRLAPMAGSLASALSLLPAGACPADEAVGVITMHPQGIAKSYHPLQLISELGLRQVGSRPTRVQPEKWTRQDEPELSPTTDLYVAGSRQSFARCVSVLSRGATVLSRSGQEQLRRIEQFRAPGSSERIRIPDSPVEQDEFYDVTLHAASGTSDAYIVQGFREFASSLGVEADLSRALYAGGLCFLPVVARRAILPALSQFSFLRLVRPVPGLRSVTPVERSVSAPDLPGSVLPDEDALEPSITAAIFDGGLVEKSQLSRWSRSFDADKIGKPEPGTEVHGHDVTSAFLFGDLTPGEPAARPFSNVDHYRVLDENSGQDPYVLYDVLGRITEVLRGKSYDFVNLSLGPSICVEDDEVHPWTAVLDSLLSGGSTFLTVAVGNNGSLVDPESRIQVPGDCVNAFCVGAADSSRDGWKRAPYSAIGPGRSPGRIKPDVLAFGGNPRDRFLVVDQSRAGGIAATYGTSFASPAALRLAAGLRAHFGASLRPLGLKALLISAADGGGMSKPEVGWGRLPGGLNEIVECEDNEVRVLYQGSLGPGQYMRALIPLPNSALAGNVSIQATLCYSCEVDPQDPGSYTRSGLEVTFRPHSGKFKNADSSDPNSQSFFKKSEYDSERTLRNDAQKWETVLRADRTMRGTSLNSPVFDIHYNARLAGGSSSEAREMAYALVVRVTSARTADLYDQVVKTYSGLLEVMQPVIEIPLSAQ